MSLDATHSYLTKMGGVSIAADGHVRVEGFDGDGCTCRDVATLALVWAIGVLQKELMAQIERPGGSGKVCCD
jgi:hypothetical protein